MSNQSIWILSDESEQSSLPIINYIQEQGRELSYDTNGKLKGVLVHAGVSWKEMATVLSNTVDGITNGLYHTSFSKGAKDASRLYYKQTYEFIIVDEAHKYELSLFQITCNDTLPASLAIDPTIAEESSLSKQVEIGSLERFKDIFEDIVRSRKVIYIIDRLMKLPPDTNETSAESKSDSENATE